jgi:hypothetical protein
MRLTNAVIYVRTNTEAVLGIKNGEFYISIITRKLL